MQSRVDVVRERGLVAAAEARAASAEAGAADAPRALGALAESRHALAEKTEACARLTSFLKQKAREAVEAEEERRGTAEALGRMRSELADQTAHVERLRGHMEELEAELETKCKLLSHVEAAALEAAERATREAIGASELRVQMHRHAFDAARASRRGGGGSGGGGDGACLPAGSETPGSEAPPALPSLARPPDESVPEPLPAEEDGAAPAQEELIDAVMRVKAAAQGTLTAAAVHAALEAEGLAVSLAQVKRAASKAAKRGPAPHAEPAPPRPDAADSLVAAATSDDAAPHGAAGTDS